MPPAPSPIIKPPPPGPLVTEAELLLNTQFAMVSAPTEPWPPELGSQYQTAPPWPTEPFVAHEPTHPADDDVIYRRMLSEMQGDPHDLLDSRDLDWRAVWERGWSMAAEADDKPVESRTAQNGLPVRQPGERLVPGGANGAGVAVRDPEAVRASISSHFGGVRAGRAQARGADEGAERQ
jgi:hypothetical protein